MLVSSNVASNTCTWLNANFSFLARLKKIQEKKKINKQKAEAQKKARGITNGKNIISI